MNALLGADVYALSEEAPVELRILHGAQAGSRLCLATGEYLLGRDDSCTLILEGSGIEDRHAILRFDGDAAWIEPVDGVVRNAHGDEIHGEQELTFGLPVELGSIWISVDREDAPWPDPKSVTPIRAKNIGDAEIDAAPDSHGESSIGVPDQLPAADALFVRPPERSKWLRYVLPVVLLVAAGGIGAFAFFPAKQANELVDAAPPMTKVDHDPAPLEVQDLLKDYPRARLVWQQEPGQGQGRWIVRGYLPSADQQRELSNVLALMSPNAQLKVFVEEELEQGVKQILAEDASAAYARVQSVKGGVVQLTGAVASADEIERLEAKLLASVTGISEVKSQILLPDQLRKLLRDRIAAAGLGERLAVTSEKPEMKLAGRLTMEEIRRWEELLVTFNREYGNVLPIRATVSRLIPKPPVGVLAIVGGPVPYIVTQTGEHVNQGGDVNGHTLVSVKDGEVVFEGQQRVRIAR